MGDHLYHAALQRQHRAVAAEYARTAGAAKGNLEDHEEAQRHETHVRDGRVRDELLHVLLGQGHEGDVDDGDERQHDDHARQGRARVRSNGQAEAHEAVATHLQQHRRQDHRTAGGRLHVGVGEPGVHRPHGHLDREGQQERHEDPLLFPQRQGQIVEGQDRVAAGLQVQVDQRHQHEDRAQEGEQEELHGGVDPALAAPDADDDEHRHQHRFPEDVEEQPVQRRKDADHQPFHEQERGEVLGRAQLDHPPSGEDHQRRQQRSQQNQRQRNTVQAEVVVDVEALDPRNPLDELHLGRGDVEPEIQRQAQDEDGGGGHQRHQLAAVCARLARAQGEHGDAGQDGQPYQQTQHRETAHRLPTCHPCACMEQPREPPASSLNGRLRSDPRHACRFPSTR